MASHVVCGAPIKNKPCGVTPCGSKPCGAAPCNSRPCGSSASNGAYGAHNGHNMSLGAAGSHHSSYASSESHHSVSHSSQSSHMSYGSGGSANNHGSAGAHSGHNMSLGAPNSNHMAGGAQGNHSMSHGMAQIQHQGLHGAQGKHNMSHGVAQIQHQGLHGAQGNHNMSHGVAQIQHQALGAQSHHKVSHGVAQSSHQSSYGAQSHHEVSHGVAQSHHEVSHGVAQSHHQSSHGAHNAPDNGAFSAQIGLKLSFGAAGGDHASSGAQSHHNVSQGGHSGHNMSQGGIVQGMSNMCVGSNNNYRPYARECEELYNAFKGFGCDEATVIKLLVNASMEQRIQMRETYKLMYKEDLIKRLQKELTGTFETAMVLWMQEPAERDAMIARDALQGWRTANRALTEVICTRSSVEIAKIREAYKKLTCRNLDDDVACKTKGPFQRLLGAMLSAHRCGSCNVDMNLAMCDARALYDAGEARCGTDENVFICILSKRSVAQLRATLKVYKETYCHDLTTALHRDTQKEFEDAVRVIVKCVYAPSKYFAKVLNVAVRGMINDTNTVVRVVVTRSEIDLNNIANVYYNKYKLGLVEMFKKELSGHLKEFFLAISHRAGLNMQCRAPSCKLVCN